MNHPPSERPNRLATCPVCGAQMPRRFLDRHQKQHNPTADGAPAVSAAETVQERSGTVLCPACGQFVMGTDFSDHMAGSHADWCPLCRSVPKDLLDHLKRSHHMKPLQTPAGGGRNWQTQPRFVCLWCKKPVSVWSYPRHAQPHHTRKKPPAHNP